MAASTSRPIRVAACSGSASDRRDALCKLAKNHPNDPLDGIIGDWMSEANMTSRGAGKVTNPTLPAYEPSFLESLAPALPKLAQNKIKLVVNAGCSDTQRLHSTVVNMIEQQNLQLNVAWISGDEVLPEIKRSLEKGESIFQNPDTGEKLTDWKHAPIYAQAYLGGWGITAALSSGADIVLCGRVSDASLLVGLVAWWHNWHATQIDCLANTLIAGHLIECSSYACGGNFTGFRHLNTSGLTDIGFPIAEVSLTGQVEITKSKGSGGELSVDTATAQLLYEIQGPLYFNSDVVADISTIEISQLKSDRVVVRGVRGNLPPPTTKVGITAPGGFQAEIHWFIVGLDVAAKAAMLEAQIRHALASHIHRFSVLEFTLNGISAENPKSLNAATVDFRVLAQAPRQEDLSPSRFSRPITNLIMVSYPGATFHLDLRMALPKPIFEYYVTRIAQDSIRHKAHMPWVSSSSASATIVIDPPATTRTYPTRQLNVPTTSLEGISRLQASGGIHDAAGGWAELPAQPGKNVVREIFGPWGRTIRGPLGWVAHARSGDKGSNANVGFWVSGNDLDKWDWLRSLLSTKKLRDLLGDEYLTSLKRRSVGQEESDNIENWIERFEFPGIRAVHFLLRQHLDRGASCTRTCDFLGKNLAEFLRARWVDLPIRFLPQTQAKL